MMFFKHHQPSHQRHPPSASLHSLSVLVGGEYDRAVAKNRGKKVGKANASLGCGMKPKSSVLFSGCVFSRRTEKTSIASKASTGQVQFPTNYDPNIKLETYAFVLSLNDITLNTFGMEKLLQAAKPPIDASCEENIIGDNQEIVQKNIVARALVYGGQPNSPEERLRFAFVGFLCNEYPCGTENQIGYHAEFPHTTQHAVHAKGKLGTDEEESHTEQETDHSCSSEDAIHTEGNENNDTTFSHDESSFDEDEDHEDEYLRGVNWGSLHLLALKVLERSLEQILTTARMAGKQPKRIDFNKDAFWSCIIDTLTNNIEMNHGTKITGYSLKCLRLMHSIEPFYVQSLLQHSLLPYLLYLQECGGADGYHLRNHRIQHEASRLLKRAEIYESLGDTASTTTMGTNITFGSQRLPM